MERSQAPMRPFSRSASDAAARRTYELLDEPVGRDYRELIAAAVAECPIAVLTVGGDRMSDDGRDVVEKLRPQLLGTSSTGSGSHLVRFALNAESSAVLGDATDRLYAWRRPALPDNLCLLRGDGSPWLMTIAAERLGYIELSQLERVRLGRVAPHVASVLAHQGAHDAIRATFERRLEERVDPLVEELLRYARTLPDVARDGLADALQEWVISTDDLRVAVALEMIASLRLGELGVEVRELRAKLDDPANVPAAVAGNSVLKERWRVRRRQLVDGVLVQLGEGPAAPQ